jgi:hypothetical protein
VTSWTKADKLRLHNKHWHGPYSCSVVGCRRGWPNGYNSQAELDTHQDNVHDVKSWTASPRTPEGNSASSTEGTGGVPAAISYSSLNTTDMPLSKPDPSINTPDPSHLGQSLASSVPFQNQRNEYQPVDIYSASSLSAFKALNFQFSDTNTIIANFGPSTSSRSEYAWDERGYQYASRYGPTGEVEHDRGYPEMTLENTAEKRLETIPEIPETTTQTVSQNPQVSTGIMLSSNIIKRPPNSANYEQLDSSKPPSGVNEKVGF